MDERIKFFVGLDTHILVQRGVSLNGARLSNEE